MYHYEYRGKKPLIGEPEPTVRYLKALESGKLTASLMPYTIALELINGAMKVEESEEQEAFNKGGIIIDGGRMLFSMEDFEQPRKTVRKTVRKVVES